MKMATLHILVLALIPATYDLSCGTARTSSESSRDEPAINREVFLLHPTDIGERLERDDYALRLHYSSYKRITLTITKRDGLSAFAKWLDTSIIYLNSLPETPPAEISAVLPWCIIVGSMDNVQWESLMMINEGSMEQTHLKTMVDIFCRFADEECRPSLFPTSVQ
jgi:hypothetical protein